MLGTQDLTRTRITALVLQAETLNISNVRKVNANWTFVDSFGWVSGGGGGSRTRVRNYLAKRIYVCIRFLVGFAARHREPARVPGD